MTASWQDHRQRGREASDAGLYDEAAAHFAAARRALERGGNADDARMADALDLAVAEGTALVFAARLAEALERLDPTLSEAEVTFGWSHPLTVRAGLALGNVLFRIGRVEDAATQWFACQGAIETGVEVSDQVRALVRNNLGGVYYHRGDHERAIACFAEALADMEVRLGSEHKELMRPLCNLSWLALEAGRLEEAESAARRAVTVAEKACAPDDAEGAHARLALAIVLTNQGRLRPALELLDHILATLPGEHNLRVTIGVNLADLYRRLGDLDTARTHARAAARIAESVLDRRDPFRTAVLRSQAYLALAAGDLDEAAERVDRAMAVERDVPDMWVEARIANRIAAAEVGVAVDDAAGAATLALEGLALLGGAPSLRLPDVEAKLLALLGEARVRSGDLERGRRDLDAAEAIASSSQTIMVGTLQQLLDARISAAAAQDDAAEAMRAAELAVASLERHRAEEFALLDMGSRSRRSAHGLAWFERLLTDPSADAPTRSRRAEAWFAHHNAASSALAALVRWHDHASEEARTDALAYRACLQTLASAATRPEVEQRDTLRARLASLEQRAANAQFDAVARALGPVRVAELAAHLAADEALCAMAWLDQHVIAMSLTPDGRLRLGRAHRAEPLAADIASLRMSFDNGSLADEATQRRVAAALLEPHVLGLPDVKHLVVVPDGAASLVPWSVLTNAARLDVGLSTVVVAQTPSVRRFAEARSDRPRPALSEPSCVVADPDFGSTDILHGYRGNAAGDVVPSLGFRTWMAALRLPRLSHARDEVDLVTGFDPSCRSLVGGAATVEALLSVRRPRLLHVATHGFVYPGPDDLGLPLLRPVLALAGARAAARRDERSLPPGFLPALGMLGMDLEGTELVMLSACGSSVGSTLPGEGTAGMPQALLAAGAGAVVATLWRVRDCDAVEVARAFYRHLAQDPRPSNALARTQRAAGYRGAAAAFVCWT